MDNDRIEIYYKPGCPYSRRALALLDRLGADYEAIDVTDDAAREREMVERSGRATVPEVFVGGAHIGGFDDLNQLYIRGRLERLLGLDFDGDYCCAA